MKKLENITAELSMGDVQTDCLKGSLDYLGIEISKPWLAGTTGQTFVISIHRQICLSSVGACWVEAYRDGTMTRLGRNLGYKLECYSLSERDSEPQETRASLWRRLQEAIDAGHPCYGYYNFCYQLYSGYDDDGFYIGDGATNAGQGPFPVQELGQLCVVSPAGAPADDHTAVKDALLFTLAHAGSGKAGQPHDSKSDYAHGAAAYNRWIAAMAAGKESGTWRAIEQYVRCRELGVAFLAEAEDRLKANVSPLLKEARAHYQTVCENLWPIVEVFGMNKKPVPFGQPGSFHAKAAARLRSAGDAEKKGLAVLEKIAALL